ncbi:ClpXP protease specificity-enhancing factor [Vibrio viridaestus]|uniref:Stringent starvation protein B n=1 Tax=Vibrio viridaestus TaxID=2487322 RepID=A0A3N9TFR3_9VIBR|nr:ClpXP protease specificity-enhancing factor [Vibrio viridaestus]RQW63098.1 ClpXP protease specificity-enhancing factor [Vibrio viridaestus]
MDMSQMTPRRPYMLRAFYDWLLDNDLTPHLVVDATLAGVRVPMEFVQDGQIILNVAPRAVGNLELGNDEVRFNARFSGKPHTVIVPLFAIQAIYARENGAGTMFEPEDAYISQLEEAEEAENTPEVSLSVATESDIDDSNESSEDDESQEPPRPKGKPSLRVIK